MMNEYSAKTGYSGALRQAEAILSEIPCSLGSISFFSFFQPLHQVVWCFASWQVAVTARKIISSRVSAA